MIITLYRPGSGGKILYYSIHDRQPLLTARYSLTLAWRTGDSQEREKIYGFDSLSEKNAKIKDVLSRKKTQGYRVLYSFQRAYTEAVPEDATGA